MEWKHDKKTHTYWTSYSNNGYSCVLAFARNIDVDKISGECISFWTMFGVGKNRKQVLSWMNNKTTFINGKITGNGDISFLLFARRAMHDFEEYIKKVYKNRPIRIDVGAYDKRRYEIYKRCLVKRGYEEMQLFPFNHHNQYNKILYKWVQQ